MFVSLFPLTLSESVLSEDYNVMNDNTVSFCPFSERVPLSSNYASVRHVPSLDSISSVMDGLHLQMQDVRQVA